MTALARAELWTRDPDNHPLFSLQGPVGMGKTAIARTFSKHMSDDGRLGASFFFSRNSQDRTDLRRVFSTLAVQLARTYPKFHVELVKAADFPALSYRDPHEQMKSLLVQPFKASGVSTIIVIDAIDECEDPEAVLSILGKLAPQIPKVKFFLTSRETPHVQLGFQIPSVAELTSMFKLHEVGEKSISDDIRLFFNHKFLELARHHEGSRDWLPVKEVVNLLCERAEGLFVFAVATMSYVSAPTSTPRDRLETLLRSPDSTTHEGKAPMKGDSTRTLDSLYRSILQDAFKENGNVDYDMVRLVLGTVFLSTTPLAPSAVAELLGLKSSEVLPLLSSLRSVLVLRDENPDESTVRYHKSFSDFITDSARCTDDRFLIPTPKLQAELLLNCISLMQRRLKETVFAVPDVTHSATYDSQDTVEQHPSPALRYACTSWHKHLTGPHQSDSTVPAVRHFLKKNFIVYLEMLRALGAVRDAVHALAATRKWLTEVRSVSLLITRLALTQSS